MSSLLWLAHPHVAGRQLNAPALNMCKTWFEVQANDSNTCNTLTSQHRVIVWRPTCVPQYVMRAHRCVRWSLAYAHTHMYVCVCCTNNCRVPPTAFARLCKHSSSCLAIHTQCTQYAGHTRDGVVEQLKSCHMGAPCMPTHCVRRY